MVVVWVTLAVMNEGTPNKKFRYDDSGEVIDPRQSLSNSVRSAPEPTLNRKLVSKKKNYPHLLTAILILVVIVVIGGLGTWFFLHKNSSPVPKTISQAVDFPVYYPNPKNLPSGYSLNLGSFNLPVKNGVTYKVSYGNGKNIVFSLQPKLSASDYQTFEGNYLPLKTPYQTPIGQAEIGAYNLETLVSLPVSGSNTWIIITAPGNINQDQLQQVLSSLKD